MDDSIKSIGTKSIDDIIIKSVELKEKRLKDLVFDNKDIQQKLEQKATEILSKYYLEDAISKNYVGAEYINELKSYIFIPQDVKVKRVPSYVLGKNVLGRAFTGLRIIEILDTLYGEFYNMVLDHEAGHIKDPDASEYAMRKRSKERYPDEFQKIE